jgi:pimeloyl-ACP methyl ester carboxylesterase
MHRLAAFVVAAFVLAAPDAESAPPPARSPLARETCRFPVASELQARTLCYRLAVPRDYANPAAGEFQLAVVVQKSAQPAPGRRPLLLLHGGPGGRGAAAGLGRLREPFAPGADTVTFDQRGNGLSEPDVCNDIKPTIREAIAAPGDGFTTAWRINEPYARCRARFAAAGLRPEYFGTRATSRDAERLRLALGIARWDIISVSYGTIVALDMMAANPRSVGSVVLDSPVGLVPTQETRETPLQRPVLNLFVACERDAACNAAYPHLRAEYQATFAALDAKPLVVPVDAAATHGIAQVDLNGVELEFLLRRLMRSASSLGAIPRVLKGARDRDPEILRPLVTAAIAVVPEDNSLGRPAVMCHDIPALHDMSPPRSTIDLGQMFGICPLWGAAGPGPRLPGRTGSDVLLLVGELDPLIEPGFVASLTHRLGPKARVVSFPAATHVVWGPGCPARIVARFYEAPAAAPDLACVGQLPGIQFAQP